MASFTKTKHGWGVRISAKNSRWYKGSDEPRYLRDSKQPFQTKAAAREWAETRKKELENGVSDFTDLSVPDYFEKWFERFKKGKYSENTDHIYEKAIDKYREYLSDVKMKELNQLVYQTFVDDLADKGYAKNSILSYHKCFKVCLKQALYDEVIPKDPTFNVTIRGVPPKKEEEKYLELDRLKQLTSYFLEHFQDMYTRVLFLQSRTGMRIGEALGVTIDRIDFDNHTLTVDRQWDHRAKKFKPTKNEKKRVIDLAPSTIAFLKQCIADIRRLELKKGFRNEEGFLFPSARLHFARPTDYKRVQRKLKTYLIEVFGEETTIDIGTHAFRHTYGSSLLLAGADVMYVADQLGDTIEVVERTYLHLLNELRKRNVKILHEQHG